MNAVVIAMLLSATQYNRSHVDDMSANSQCLYWHGDTKLVYVQSKKGNPETPEETEFSAVSKSFATWQTQLAACASLSFEEGDRSPSRTVGYNQNGSNENLVLFRQEFCTDIVNSTDACFRAGNCGNKYDCWEHAANALAITTTTYNPDTGRVFDSDVELNHPNFVFTTVDAPPCLPPVYNTTCVAADVQNTMTHEIGHFLGLAHYSNDSSVMSPRANPGELSKRTLDLGTAQFVCDVYPKGEPAKSCLIPTLGVEKGSLYSSCQIAPGSLLALVAFLLLRRRNG